MPTQPSTSDGVAAQEEYDKFHRTLGGKIYEGLLNVGEVASCVHDPCFGCVSHSLPDQMPLEVTIHKADGEVLNVLK